MQFVFWFDALILAIVYAAALGLGYGSWYVHLVFVPPILTLLLADFSSRAFKHLVNK